MVKISYGVHISGVELSGLFEEGESWVSVHHILDHAQEVFRQEVVPHTTTQDTHKPRCHVMAGRDHSVQENHKEKACDYLAFDCHLT